MPGVKAIFMIPIGLLLCVFQGQQSCTQITPSTDEIRPEHGVTSGRYARAASHLPWKTVLFRTHTGDSDGNRAWDRHIKAHSWALDSLAMPGYPDILHHKIDNLLDSSLHHGDSWLCSRQNLDQWAMTIFRRCAKERLQRKSTREKCTEKCKGRNAETIAVYLFGCTMCQRLRFRGDYRHKRSL
jgi:hypothetical protein